MRDSLSRPLVSLPTDPSDPLAIQDNLQLFRAEAVAYIQEDNIPGDVQIDFANVLFRLLPLSRKTPSLPGSFSYDVIVLLINTFADHYDPNSANEGDEVVSAVRRTASALPNIDRLTGNPDPVQHQASCPTLHHCSTLDHCTDQMLLFSSSSSFHQNLLDAVSGMADGAFGANDIEQLSLQMAFMPILLVVSWAPNVFSSHILRLRGAFRDNAKTFASRAFVATRQDIISDEHRTLFPVLYTFNTLLAPYQVKYLSTSHRQPSMSFASLSLLTSSVPLWSVPFRSRTASLERESSL